MDVLSLRGVLTLDKSEYDKGLTEADTQAKGFGGKMSKAMKVGTLAVAALGAGTVLLGKKLVDGARNVAEYGDHVDKMSQKIGISSDAYQKWDYVMKRAGGNVDSLKMGMKTLSQQAEKNSDAFQKLGISEEQVANLSKEDLFTETVKGLSEMEDSTERTALATKLLGRAGADMAPLFNQGSEAIEEQMEIAEKYGMVMPEETVKASAAFEDSMTTLQMTAQGLKNRLLGEFLPAMTKVTDGLAKMFIGDMSGLDDIVDGVKGFISKIGELVPKVLEMGGKIIGELIKGLLKKIPELLSTGGDLLSKLMEGLQNALPNAVPIIANIISSIGNFIAQNAPKLISTGISLIIALGKGLLQALPSLISNIPTLIQGIVSAFTSFNWANLGKTVITAIGKGIKNAGTALISSAKTVMNNFKNTVSNAFGAARDRAVSYMNSLKTSVTNKIQAAKDKAQEIVDKIKGLFPFSIKKVFNLPKLPKISISTGHKKVGMVNVPYPILSWNAKAMQNPYLFTGATLFGAGEAGDEMLYGKNALMNDIKEAVGGTGTYNYTFNVYATENQSPREIAEAVRQIIIQDEKRRKVAWA